MSPTIASRGAPRMPLPTRSENRAASTSDGVGARANRGLDKAPRPYPMTASVLRLPSLSLSQPEKSLEMDAVASPIPSMRPIISVLAPITEVRNTGNRPWIISDEMSMNMLTVPSAHIPPGNLASADRASGGADSWFMQLATLQERPRTTACESEFRRSYPFFGDQP